MKKFLERSKGFTLVELMVVIAIIGILAVIALGIVRGAQQRAVNATIKATASNLTTAIESYYTIASEYPATLDDLWAAGANRVLDQEVRLPSNCTLNVSTAASATACSIGYVPDSDLARGYTLTYKDLSSPLVTIQGGLL